MMILLLLSLVHLSTARNERFTAQNDYEYLWPEALIPFRIDEDFFDKETIHHIREAMNNWEFNTCIRFVPYIDQSDYIFITSSDTGCWSYVGRQTGRQLLMFNEGCTTGEVITFELGHAIGILSAAPTEMKKPEDPTKKVHSTILHFSNVLTHPMVGINASTPLNFIPHSQAIALANKLYKCALRKVSGKEDDEKGGNDSDSKCGWWEWSTWSQCSGTCVEHDGRNTQLRRKVYLGNVEEAQCGVSEESRECGIIPCSGIDDECYGSWSKWSLCSTDCGAGQEHRIRDRVSEKDSVGDVCYDTKEYLFQARECLTNKPCKFNCEVGEWTTWEACSQECGIGRTRRVRQIVKSPTNGGVECPQLFETKQCNDQTCPDPRTCDMSSWNDWSSCSAGCGGGKSYRFRSITRHPIDTSARCPPTEQSTTCNSEDCPLSVDNEKQVDDCEVTAWAPWSACSKKCGNGIIHRFRVIVRKPKNGGQSCGNLEENKPCDAGFCYGSCGLTSWTEWSGCSKACGEGTQSRYRYIRHTEDPDICPSLTEIQPCVIQDTCTILPHDDESWKNIVDQDCELSDWSVWTVCTVTCGVSGEQQRFRETVHSPSGGGRRCKHLAEERFGCNENIPCPDQIGICNVELWSEWSECSVDCGEGLQRRSRSITSHTERTPCPVLEEEKYCVMETCALPESTCRMTEWDQWSVCDVECGKGIHTRSREILEGSPEFCPVQEDAETCFEESCDGSNDNLDYESQMIYSKVFDGCLSIIEEADQLIPMLVKCDRTDIGQEWIWTKKKHLYSVAKELCLEYAPVQSPEDIVFDYLNFKYSKCDETVSRFECSDKKITITLGPKTRCLSPLEAKSGDTVVRVVGVEECAGIKQDLVNFMTKEKVCKNPSLLPTPSPEPEEGCIWYRGPIISCPPNYKIRRVQMLDDTVAGECCEDPTLTRKCRILPVRGPDTYCVGGVVTGFTFIQNQQRHVRCCARDRGMTKCRYEESRAVDLEPSGCAPTDVMNGLTIVCRAGCQTKIRCCSTEDEDEASKVVIPDSCMAAREKMEGNAATIICPRPITGGSLLLGGYILTDGRIGVCCDVPGQVVSYLRRTAEQGCPGSQIVSGITFQGGTITNIVCLDIAMEIGECFTHAIDSNTRHIGCPVEHAITNISNSCYSPPCPTLVTCCKQGKTNSGDITRVGAGCTVMSAVLEGGLHAISCNKNGHENYFVSGVEIRSDNVLYVCCKAPKPYSNCTWNQGSSVECPGGQALTSASCLGSHLQGGECCDFSEKSDVTECTKHETDGNILRCPDGKAWVGVSVECPLGNCKTVIKCCKVSRKTGIIDRITDTVEDLIDSFKKKKGKDECTFFDIKQLRLGKGDEEIECTGKYNTMQSYSAGGLTCCKSKYKTSYCTIRPVLESCPKRGVMTGIRMDHEGKVKQIVCCEIDAELAYCESFVTSCGQYQVMAGISPGQLPNNATCCALTDKFTDECIARKTDYPGGLISSTQNTTSVGDCKKMCNETIGCEAFVLCPLSRTCFLKNASHDGVSRDSDRAKKGAISGEMICYRKKPFTFDGNCVEKKSDYPGGEIARQMATTLNSCVQKCLDTNLCSRVVFLESSGECHLKSKDHGGRIKSDWVLSSVSVWMRCLEEYLDIPPTEEEFELDVEETCIQNRADYPGGLMETVTDVSSISKCAEICAGEKGCVLFVVLPKSKVCFLKNNSHKGVTSTSRYADQGAIAIAIDCWTESKAKKEKEEKDRRKNDEKNNEEDNNKIEQLFDVDIQSSCVEKDTDFTGGSMARFTDVNSISKCRELCAQNDDCTRFIVFSIRRICFLKNGNHSKSESLTTQKSYSASMQCLAKEENKNKNDERKNDEMNNEEDNDKIEQHFDVDIKSSCVEKDTDFPGGSMARFTDVNSISKCREHCAQNDDCTRFIVFPIRRICFLKNKDHSKSLNSTTQKSYSASMQCLAREENKNKNDERKNDKMNNEEDNDKIEQHFDVDIKSSCVEKDTDFPGGSMARFTDVNSISKCREHCAQNDDCTRFIVFPIRRICFLKNKDHSKSLNSTTQKSYSASMQCLAREEEKKTKKFINDRKSDTCIRVNTDIDGITLKSIKAVPRTSLCHDLCVTTDKCTAYVIRNRACTLKAAPNSYSEVPVDDVIAGKLSCELEEMDADDESTCIEENIDYPGGLLFEEEDVESAFICQDYCQNLIDCAAFTFIPKKKLCMLRSSKHKALSKTTWAATNGAISGIIDCNGNDENENDRKSMYIDLPEDKIERDTFYDRGLISYKYKVPSLSACVQLCKEEKSCVKVVSFPIYKRCALKNNHHRPAKRRKGLISVAVSFNKDYKEDESFIEIKKTHMKIDIPQARLERDTYYPRGVMYAKDQVLSLTECVRLCEKNKCCVMVVVYPFYKRCALKNDKHGKAKHLYGSISIAVSSKVSPSDDKTGMISMKFDIPKDQIEKGRNYPLGSISTKTSVSTLSACLKLCSKDKDCVRIVAVPKFGKCILKNKNHENAVERVGYISVAMPSKKNPSPSKKKEKPSKETNKDKTGMISMKFDIPKDQIEKARNYPLGSISTKTSVSTLSACLKLCSKDKDCVRIVAVPKFGKCILKNKNHENAVERVGYISVAMPSKKNPSPSKKKEKPSKETNKDKTGMISMKFDIPKDQIEKGRNYPLGSISTKTSVSTLSACLKLCSKDKDCVRIVAVPKFGKCTLKNKNHENAVERVGYISVSMPSKKNPSPSKKKEKPSKETNKDKTGMISMKFDIPKDQIEKGRNYPLGSISTKTSVSTLSACLKLCSKDKDCVRIVAVPKFGKCTLKNKNHENAVERVGYISVSMPSKKNPSPSKKKEKPSKETNKDKTGMISMKFDIPKDQIEKGRNYPLGSISTKTSVSTLSACLKLCSKDKDCVRIVAVPKFGKCTLKNKNHENAVERVGYISVSMPSKKNPSPSKKKEKPSKETNKDKTRTKSVNPTKDNHEDKNVYKYDVTGWESSTSYPEGTISAVSGVNSLSKCAKLCKGTKNCVRIVAVPFLKRCFLKSRQHKNAQKKEGFVSLAVLANDDKADDNKEQDVHPFSCRDVFLKENPRPGYIPRVGCTGSKSIMKSIKSKSVECCTVKTCERQTCQSFSKRLTSKCPWGTVVQAIEFGKQGDIARVSCCKMSCQWSGCVERTASCKINEVIVSVTSPKCKAKPCKKVLQCCPIRKMKSKQKHSGTYQSSALPIKKRILDEISISGEPQFTEESIDNYELEYDALDSDDTWEEERVGEQSIDTHELEYNALDSDEPWEEREPVSADDVEEFIGDGNLHSEDDSLSEIDHTDFNRDTHGATVVRPDMYDTRSEDNALFLKGNTEDDVTTAEHECIHVVFDRDGDMKFGGCKGRFNVINSITEIGIKCCVGPPIKSCMLVIGKDGCPLNTIAHSIELNHGSPLIMECCEGADVVFSSCQDRIGTCGYGELVVDLQIRDCAEPCLPLVRCCSYESDNSISQQSAGAICLNSRLDWREDMQAKFGRCFSSDHVMRSVGTDVECCEGDCLTVDCTVVDMFDWKALTCPWGSLANGVGLTYDKVSYLECCVTNCRYSSCVERVGRCLEGELVQDVTLRHGDVVLKCCAVLGILLPQEFAQRRSQETHHRSKRSLTDLATYIHPSEDATSSELPTSFPLECKMVEFSEEAQAHYASCERTRSNVREVGFKVVSCCVSRCSTSRCNMVTMTSRTTYSCTPGTIINGIGKSLKSDKITALSCCDVDCRIGPCVTRDTYCNPGEVMRSISKNLDCDRLPCPYKVTCCSTIDEHDSIETQNTIYNPIKAIETDNTLSVDSHMLSAAYKKYLIPTERCPYIIRARGVTCPIKHHLELVHTIDDTMLEGKCCQSTEPMPCVPTLEKACRGFMCSVGMAGPGLFKLGCSQTEDFQAEGSRVCKKIEMRGTDVVSCPEKYAMSDITSSCPDGIHKGCVIHVTCCTDDVPVEFSIKRHVPAHVYPVELFDSVVIDCQSYKSALISKVSIGRIPEGVCGPTVAKDCYLHHSFEVSDSASCADGFAMKSISFAADGMLASPFSCCSIGDHDISETAVADSMNEADCGYGFINSVRTDTTRSDTKLQVTCVFTKENIESDEVAEGNDDNDEEDVDKKAEGDAKNVKDKETKVKEGKNTEREKNLMMVEKIVKFDEKTKINDQVDAKNEDVQDKETKGKKDILDKLAPCMFDGAILPGGNIVIDDNKDFKECMDDCRDSEVCAAGTYMPSHRRCLLKSDEHEPPKVTSWSKSKAVVSFDFKCNKSSLLENMEMKRNDTVNDKSGRELAKKPCFHFDSIYSESEVLEKLKVSNFNLCLKKCIEILNCTALTYIEESKTCSLIGKDKGVLIQVEKSAGNKVVSVDLMHSCPPEQSDPVAKLRKTNRIVPGKKSDEHSSKDTSVTPFCVHVGAYFPGGDIRSISFKRSKTCIQECKVTSNCVAASYHFDERKCVLKNKSHGPLKQTENNVVSVDFSKTCSHDKNKSELNPTEQEEKKVDHPEHALRKHVPFCKYVGSFFPGGTFMTESSKNAEVCVARCKTEDKCIAVTFHPTTEKCFLKGKGHEALEVSKWAAQNNVTTYDLANNCGDRKVPVSNMPGEDSAKDGNPPCLYHNVIINGGTYSSVDAETLEQCGEMCISQPQCSAASFVTSERQCHLKSTDHGPPAHTWKARELGAVSMDYHCDRSIYRKFMKMMPVQRKLRTASTACKYQEFALSGTVMEEITSVTEQECVYACITHDECTAFTFNESSQICYLKDSADHTPLLSERHKDIISYDFSLDCIKYKPLIPTVPRKIKLCKYPGMNYRCRVLQTITKVSSGEACVKECSKISRCSAATFIAGPNAFKCFLRGRDHGEPHSLETSPLHQLISYDLECSTQQLKNSAKTQEQTTENVGVIHTETRNKTYDGQGRFVEQSQINKSVELEKAAINHTNKHDTSEKPIENAPENPCLLNGQSFKDGLLKTERKMANSSNCFKKCSLMPNCSAATFIPFLGYCRLFDWTRSQPIKTTYTDVYRFVSYDFKCEGKTSPEAADDDVSLSADKKDVSNVSPISILSEIVSDMPQDLDHVSFDVLSDISHCLLRNQSFKGGEMKKERNVTSAKECFEICTKSVNCSALTYSPHIKTCRLFDRSRSELILTNYTLSHNLVSFDFKCANKKYRYPHLEESLPILSEKTNVSNEFVAKVVVENSSHMSLISSTYDCLLIGQVFTGGLLDVQKNVATSEECFEQCSIDEECLAASFNPAMDTCRLYDWSCEGPFVTNYAAKHKFISYDFKCEGKNVKSISESTQHHSLFKKSAPCILKDKYVIGGLLEVIENVESGSSCAEQCDMDDDCDLATFELSSKNCYLHDKNKTYPEKSAILDKIGAESFDFTCVEKQKTANSKKNGDSQQQTHESGCKLLNHMFTGGLIELLSNVSSTEDCFEECAMTQECAAVTYSPKTHKCFLRNANRRGPIITEFSKIDGVISFDFKCSIENTTEQLEETPDRCLTSGTTYTGDILETMGSINSVEDCFEECSIHDKCFVATFNPNISMCFLRANNWHGPTETKSANTRNLTSYDFACKHGDKVRIPCRLSGKAFSGPILETIFNITQGSDCSEECAMNKNCITATFHPIEQKCSLRNRKRIGPIETSLTKSTKLVSYDYLCDGVAKEYSSTREVNDVVERNKEHSEQSKWQDQDRSLLKSPDGRSYRVLLKKEFIGKPLSSFEELKSPSECMSLCSAEIRCLVATFNPMNANCTLREVKTRPLTTAFAVWNNIISFDFSGDENLSVESNFVNHKQTVPNLPTKTLLNKPCILNKQHFQGGHLKTFSRIKSSLTCYENCQKQKGCVAAVYNSVLQRCGLKNKDRTGPFASLYAKVYEIVSYDLLCDADVEITTEPSPIDERTVEIELDTENSMPSKTVYKSLAGRSYRVSFKKEILGPSRLTISDIQSPDDCMKRCSMEYECVAATFDPSNRSCALNVVNTRPIATGYAIKNELVSFQFELKTPTDQSMETNRYVTDSKLGKPCRLQNKMFLGDSIKDDSIVQTEDDCSEECREEASCVAAVYNPGNNRCSLKDKSRKGPIENEWSIGTKIVSFDFLCNANPQTEPAIPNKVGFKEPTDESIATKRPTSNSKLKKPCRLQNKMFLGDSIKDNSIVQTEDDCSEECREEASCVAAVYNPGNNRCSMKDKSRKGPIENEWSIGTKIVSFDFLCDANPQTAPTIPNKEGFEKPKDESMATKRPNSNSKLEKPCRLQNKMFLGDSIKDNSIVQTEDDCLEECWVEASCVAAVYNPGNNRCSMKDKSRKGPIENEWSIGTKIVSFDFFCNANPQTEPAIPNEEAFEESTDKSIAIKRPTRPKIPTKESVKKPKDQSTAKKRPTSNSKPKIANKEGVKKPKDQSTAKKRPTSNIRPKIANKGVKKPKDQSTAKKRPTSNSRPKIAKKEGVKKPKDQSTAKKRPSSNNKPKIANKKGVKKAKDQSTAKKRPTSNSRQKIANKKGVKKPKDQSTAKKRPSSNNKPKIANKKGVKKAKDQSTAKKRPSSNNKPKIANKKGVKKPKDQSTAKKRPTSNSRQKIANKKGVKKPKDQSTAKKRPSSNNKPKIANKKGVKKAKDQSTAKKRPTSNNKPKIANKKGVKKPKDQSTAKKRPTSNSKPKIANKKGIKKPKDQSTAKKRPTSNNKPKIANKKGVKKPKDQSTAKKRPTSNSRQKIANKGVKKPKDQSTAKKRPTSNNRPKIANKGSKKPKDQSTAKKRPTSNNRPKIANKGSKKPKDQSTAKKRPTSNNKPKIANKKGVKKPKDQSTAKKRPTSNSRQKIANKGVKKPKDKSTAKKRPTSNSRPKIANKGVKKPKDQSTAKKRPTSNNRPKIANKKGVKKPTNQSMAKKRPTSNRKEGKAKKGRSSTYAKLDEPCILNNNMYTGRYISAKSGYKSSEDCKVACANHPACLAATYISSVSKCYLRGLSHGAPQTSMWAVDNGAISFDFTCTAEPSPVPPSSEITVSNDKDCFHENAFFPNGTIEIIDNVKNVTNCGDMCNTDGNCVAFNYVFSEKSCTLKTRDHDNAISTPWAVRNKAYAFVMQYCKEEDFLIPELKSADKSRQKRGSSCLESMVRLKVGGAFDLNCHNSNGLKSLQIFQVSLNVECCKMPGDAASFEHFCSKGGNTCPGDSIINRNVKYGERCVSTCLEASIPEDRNCWDTHFSGGYVDCGKGFVNSLENLPVLVECCMFSRESSP